MELSGIDPMSGQLSSRHTFNVKEISAVNADYKLAQITELNRHHSWPHK